MHYGNLGCNAFFVRDLSTNDARNRGHEFFGKSWHNYSFSLRFAPIELFSVVFQEIRVRVVSENDGRNP